MLKFFFLSTRI